MDNKHSVLFLCTGNSCRSQMAEGLVNHLMGADWIAYSAGTRPALRVNPVAVKVMGELGIDISQHQPEHTSAYEGRPFDVVLTLCGSAEEECPIWYGATIKEHIGFEDPAGYVGDPDDELEVYRRVRDEIRAEVLPFLRSVEMRLQEQR
jgi:arsenate reductase (thioredoxin)